MHINELLVEPDTVKDDSISLRYFTDDNVSPEMAELLACLKRAESWGEVRAILSMYVDLGDGSVE